MASNYLDEFVLNFDLNQLTPEESVQAPSQSQKYERIRKSTTWLKSKIISTDYVIQKYQLKKDDYEKSVKELTATKEELKQVLINYKNATERCVTLEKENKTLLANHEVLKGKCIDAENKYDALISHTNQLQMLVKDLETERDALSVEKELAKCSNKNGSQEYKVLQNENDSMLKDLRALKDVILGKKKANKRHVKLIKKYEKDIKLKGEKFECKSDESGDEIDDCGDIIPSMGIKLSEVSNDTDILNVEQSFIDTYSDGEISVDTGRGSSRANSHDKFISSPDYVVTLESLMKLSSKDVPQRVDAANSPITVYPQTSVATSPIMIKHSVPLFVAEYGDYNDCTDDTEYIIEGTPLSEEISELVEQEKLSDRASPVSDLSDITGGGTSSIKNYEVIIVKEADVSPSDKSYFIESIDSNESNEFEGSTIIEDQIRKCACEKSDTLIINGNIELNDACTSPLTIVDDSPQYVDKGINTDENVNKTRTHVNVGTNTDTEIQFENQMARKSEKSSDNMMSLEKEMIDASTNTDLTPTEKSKLVDVEMDIVSMKQNKLHFDRQIPKTATISNDKKCTKLNNKTINKTEELRNQERVCLESNSSKILHLENSNDAEVQNILNVMKLHHDLISPISKTPCDSEYLKLIPEMNHTLTKIWSTIANIYRMPNQSRNKDINLQTSMHVNNFEDIPEIEMNSKKRPSDQEALGINKSFNQVVADDIVDRTSSTFKETSIRQMVPTDTTSLECPNTVINESQTDTVSKTTETDIIVDKLVSNTTTNKDSLTEEDKKENQHQPQIAISFDDISNCHKIGETILTEDVNQEKNLQQQCNLKYSTINEICEDNLNSITNTNNNFETNHNTETFTSHTIIVNSTKTKKKSKLEKFREKLLPTCKIKKEILSNKHLSKTFLKPKNTTSSPSLNQKIAYENAVKVMAELRSKQELQEKNNSHILIAEKELESKSSTSKSSPSESVKPNMLLTRSHTRLLSKKEVNANPDKTNDIEMSPINRRLRKRSADTEADSLRYNSKRILRSSNVPQVTNENVLQKVQSDDMAEQLQNLGDNLNPQCINCTSDSDHAMSAKSDITLERSIRRLKPVIELSECLADNANVVSIIPGKVGYLDVNKNINKARKLPKFNDNKLSDKSISSEANQLNLEKNNDVVITEKPALSTNTDNYVPYSDEGTNTSQDQSSEMNIMESKDDDSAIEYSNLCNSDKREHGKQNSPKATIEQNIHSSDSAAIATKPDLTNSIEQKLRDEANIGTRNPVVQLIPLKNHLAITNKNNILNYSDLDLYTKKSSAEDKTTDSPPCDMQRWKENILCSALDRHGVISVKYVARKVPDAITLKINQMIEESITNIIASSKTEQKNKMNDLVVSIQTFKVKHILAGLMKYLKDPTRKNELFNKIINGSAPPMTKSEVILLYIIESLNGSFHGFIDKLWNNIEHALFQLNRSPNFDVIESMSHFYAVLCRYFRNKSRLRCFMLDAMYCLQFKAVPLIRQCLDVCPGVLPSAHERMAKTSLVTCLVYLLHFYKCQDKFNRAQDIRNILYQRYQYRFSEWNETMILEIFRKAVMDLRGTHNDKKMLRVALIILCKRHGAKWCQLNIIQNILLPIIEKNDVPDKIKQFCVLMLGPLLKPFPADRKAQCEIVINQLLQMSKQNNSQEMKEAIYSSLIFMNKHDPERVVQALLAWNPDSVSSEFEEILNDFVMEKPLAAWKRLVTKNPSQCT